MYSVKFKEYNGTVDSSTFRILLELYLCINLFINEKQY